MNLKLVSPCSASFREIGRLTEPSKIALSHRWNMQVAFPDYPHAETDHGWGRINIMQEQLRNCDWMLFMGADTMPINHRIDPRSFIPEEGDIAVAFDDNGLQSDVMFLRNCGIVHLLFDTVRERRKTDFDLPWLGGTEQGCLVRTLAGMPMYMNGLTASELQEFGARVVEAPKTINRYISDFQLGDWCFHACNMSMPERVRWLTAFNKQFLQ